MARPSEVIIGLEIGLREIRGAGFDLGGREVGRAHRPLPAERPGAGRVELDPVRAWQTAVRVIHDLAAAVPDLGRRTVALGLTGASGGLCLIDEDGEPLAPMISPLERRRERARTPRRAGPPATADLLRDLLGDRASVVDQAALALDVTGWIHACLTGRPSRGTVDAAPEAGTPRFAADPDELEHLLPPPTAPRHAIGMHPAAAAVTGLRDETPVVLAPPAPLAAALAAGVADAGFAGGVAILDDDAWLVRPDEPRATAGHLVRLGDDLGALRLAPSEIGGAALDWLVALAEDLLAGGGLIGLARGELESLIDDRVQNAGPEGPTFRDRPTTGGGSWSISGLGEASMIGDLARAIYEGIGFAARAALAAGGLPHEVRLAGGLMTRAPAQAVVPACLGTRTRVLHRPAPATAGAAIAAACAIGELPDPGVGAERWIAPFLSEPASHSSGVADHYETAFKRWRTG